jgi:hypothetical protein
MSPTAARDSHHDDRPEADIPNVRDESPAAKERAAGEEVNSWPTDRLTPEIARQILGFQYYAVARRFGMLEHRHNIMGGPMDHLIRRFGRDVVPSAVADAVAG